MYVHTHAAHDAMREVGFNGRPTEEHEGVHGSGLGEQSIEFLVGQRGACGCVAKYFRANRLQM